MPLTSIKLARLRADRRQVEVVLATGIPRARYSEIECGYIQPRPDELERLAVVLGVSVEALREPESEVAR